jgi:hypothetical protein
MDTNQKIRENRLRPVANRQGLLLCKHRSRDPRHLLHGTYMLMDARTNTVAFADFASGRGYGLTLDAVADYLNEVDQ